MKMTLTRLLAVALMLAGCVSSPSTFADSAADAAQAQALKDAYARGYQAAIAASAAPPAVLVTPSGPPAPRPPVMQAPRKPILDIKETYSDAGDVETVTEEPVTATPLPVQPTTRAETTAQGTPAQTLPTRPVAAASPVNASSVIPASAEDQQEIQAEIAQIRAWGDRLAARRALQQQQAAASAPQQDPSDDDASGSEPQPDARQRVQQYTQPYQDVRPPQPPYQDEQPAPYVPPSTGSYAAPPPPWISQHQPPPPTTDRMYWSPEYGRWLYY